MKASKLKKSFLKPMVALMTAAFALCVFSAPRADAASTGVEYMSAFNGALEYLASSGEPVFGSVGGEWTVFALARAGYFQTGSDYFRRYYSRIEATVESCGSAVINPNKSTDNSRVVIALASIGRDPRSVAGHNLVEPLYDFDYVKKQGISGVIFALLALDSCAAGSGDIRARCVNYLLNRELEAGGWALGAGTADPDITAMTVYALAKYASASSAVNRGIEVLSTLQLDDGGYMSMGSANSESCAQVITALSAVGIDAAKDERFIKDGNSLLDAFLDYRSGSGFSHIAGTGVNRMATEQAAYALAAYVRFKTGRPALYDMSDVVAEADPTATQGQQSTPTPTPKATPAVSTAPNVPATPALSGFEAPDSTPSPTIIAACISTPRVDAQASVQPEPTPGATIVLDGSENTESEGNASVKKTSTGGYIALGAGAAAVCAVAATCLIVALKKRSKDVDR